MSLARKRAPPMEESDLDVTGTDVGPSSTTVCWRCGLAVTGDAAKCPHCGARLRTVTDGPNVSLNSLLPSDSLKLFFWSYGLLLLTGIIHALVLGLTVDLEGPLDAAGCARIIRQILVVEGIDTIVIGVTLALAWRRMLHTQPPHHVRITAWIASLPVVGGLIALNLAYHWVLRELLHVPVISDELLSQFDALAILAICVQPAIVEEAYFRLFALDSLRQIAGLHAAVWISATMFGFVHVANLFGIPYLIVLGACLAYLRLASGTLLLPIVVHFVHNLIVMLLDSWMQ